MILSLLALALAADPIVVALHAELDRNARELALPNAPGPWFLGYQLAETERANFTAAYGGIVSESVGPARWLGASVRVGSEALDNSRFGQTWTDRGFGTAWLAQDGSPVETSREAWLLADTQYKAAVEALARKEAARRTRIARDRAPDFAPGEGVSFRAPAAPFEPADASTLRERCRQISAVMLDHPDVLWSQARCSGWGGRRVVLDTVGTDVQVGSQGVQIRMMASALAPDGSQIWDSETWLVRRVADLPPQAEMVASSVRLAERLEAWRGAPAAEEEYAGPVVFTGEAARDLFAVLLLPELSGTPGVDQTDFRGEISTPARTPLRLNRRVLPSGWSVLDDPQSDLRLSSGYTHDAEGVPAAAVKLVQDGLIRDLLMCRVPNLERDRSNGHAVDGFGEEPQAGPTQVRIDAAKALSRKKLFKAALDLAEDYGLDYVLEVRRLSDPRVTGQGDPDVFGRFFSVGQKQVVSLPDPVEVVRHYPDGREELVRGLTFGSVDLRTLRDIVAAGGGRDHTFLMAQGTGPSDPMRGQVVTLTAPDVVIEELVLTPDEVDARELPRVPSPIL